MSADQIQQIISALKSAAGGGWQALVSQQLTTGWIGLIAAAFMFLIGIITLIVGLVCLKKANFNRVTPANVIGCWAAVISVSMLIAGIALFFVDLNQVINPAGAAIQQLVGGL